MTRRHLSSSAIELGKKAAAFKAVDDAIHPALSVIGIGSGSTIRYVIDRIQQRNDLNHVVYIPTSFQSRILIQKANLKLGSLEQYAFPNFHTTLICYVKLMALPRYPAIDVTVDGADEVDGQLNCIKGGGACHLQEKIIAFASNRFIVVADDRKKSVTLGVNWTKGVPIEVMPMAYSVISFHLKKHFPSTKSNLRMASEKAGPVVTDNGNFIIDAHFGPISSPSDLENMLIKIPGVIEVGLFCNMTDRAYFGSADGSIYVQDRE
ncbi:ribose-5-phosphate isomerase [Umbelopsis sp. PMI_123]|nr:ribose-5-phosphate isomerase [Umbelopsis sp. PMI_123]